MDEVGRATQDAKAEAGMGVEISPPPQSSPFKGEEI